MTSRIFNEFLSHRLSDVFFIEMNKDSGPLKKGTNLPVVFSDLKNQISENQEAISQNKIIMGMLFVSGLENNIIFFFVFFELLDGFGEGFADAATALILSSDQSWEDKYIMMCGLYNMYNDDATLFNCGKLAYQNSIESPKDFLQKSFEIFTKLMEEGYDNPYVPYYLGFIDYNMGRFSKTYELWEVALEGEISDEAKQEILEVMPKLRNKLDYELGYEYILSGRFEDGIALLQPLLDEYSDWWNLLFFLGLGYRFMEEYDRALYYFGRAHDIEPHNTDILNEIGICYTMQGEFEGAVSVYENAITLNPKNAPLYCNKGIALYQLGREEEAIEMFKHSYELDPEDEITTQWIEYVNAQKNKTE